MSFAYDMVVAGKYNKTPWFDISIPPPIGVPILVNIKKWGCALGRVSYDKNAFIFSLPHEDSSMFLQRPIKDITHWAVIPEIE